MSTQERLPLMTIADVAGMLNVGIRHVRRLVHEKRIPYIKWGHLIRFDRAEIAQWLEEGRRPAAG